MRRITALLCLFVFLGCRATETMAPVMDLSTIEATTVHVGSLEGSSYFLSGTGSHNPGTSGWGAEVIITVIDDLGQPVEGANVTGKWIVGNKTITRSCEVSAGTGPEGVCRMNVGQKVNHNTASVTWTVTGITHASLTYDASANVANTITFQRPVVPVTP